MKIIKKSIDFEEESGPTQDELTHLRTLVEKQVQLQNKLESIYDQAYNVMDQLNELRLKKLPEYADSIGVDSITLKTGEKFEVKKELTAKIPKKNEEDCFHWMKSHGHGSLINNELSLKFDASEEDNTRFCEALNLLRDNGVSFERKQFIHPARLKKFAKEQIEKGNWSFDRKQFGVYEVNQSMINGKKPPKFKKEK